MGSDFAADKSAKEILRKAHHDGLERLSKAETDGIKMGREIGEGHYLAAGS